MFSTIRIPVWKRSVILLCWWSSLSLCVVKLQQNVTKVKQSRWTRIFPRFVPRICTKVWLAHLIAYFLLLASETTLIESRRTSETESNLGPTMSTYFDLPSLKKIIWVIGVLRRTVVGDWRFDNLCGSHLQSQLFRSIACATIVEGSFLPVYKISFVFHRSAKLLLI